MSFTFRHEFDQYLRRATPSLPEELRRLIDEAVAAGRVTKVPEGVSAIPYPVWCEREKVLVEVSPKTAVELHREARDRGLKASAEKRRLRPHIQSEIADMAAAGLGVMEISRALGINRKTVSKYLAAASASGRPKEHVSAIQRARTEQAQKRRAKVWALHQQGKSGKEIAALIGWSPKRVSKDLNRARQEFAREAVGAEGIAA